MLTIVVPTYKEADNLEPLAVRIDSVLQPVRIDYELLIVDDCSPDDTISVCETLSNRFPLKLLQSRGRPRDLSLSVLDGVRAAHHNKVLVMDADLSHPPEKIPEMLAVLEEDPEAFVLGSRYIAGGGFDRDWSLWRFLNSHAATVLARPLIRCLDPMSGFFLFARERLGDLASMRPIGYKIGLELMVRGNFSRVAEIPIGFVDRAVGESKMDIGQQWKYLRHLRRLYLHKFGSVAEFVHFGAVGASGFMIDIAFYYLFQLFGLPHQVARAFSFWPAVSWNWALNRMTTFGERKKRPKGRQWFEFAVASLVGFSINWGIYVSLTGNIVFFDHYRLLALLAGVAGASLFNFTMSTLFVYSEKRG